MAMNSSHKIAAKIALTGFADAFEHGCIKRLSSEERAAVITLCRRYWRVHKSRCDVCCQMRGDRCEFGAALWEFVK